MSVFKKPVAREAPSARRAPASPEPSPLEAGLKGVMDSIGSAMEAAQSAWSSKGKLPEDAGSPADGHAGEPPQEPTPESPGDPATEPAQRPVHPAADRRAVTLVVGLLGGGLALFFLFLFNIAMSQSGGREEPAEDRYRQDVQECSARYQDLSSTAFAVAVTECMERRGHDQSFVRNPIR